MNETDEEPSLRWFAKALKALAEIDPIRWAMAIKLLFG